MNHSFTSEWIYMTNNRWLYVYYILFSLITFWGACSKVDVIWNATDLINAGLLLMNIFGILYFLPKLKQAITAFES